MFLRIFLLATLWIYSTLIKGILIFWRWAHRHMFFRDIFFWDCRRIFVKDWRLVIFFKLKFKPPWVFNTFPYNFELIISNVLAASWFQSHHRQHRNAIPHYLKFTILSSSTQIIHSQPNQIYPSINQQMNTSLKYQYQSSIHMFYSILCSQPTQLNLSLSILLISSSMTSQTLSTIKLSLAIHSKSTPMTSLFLSLWFPIQIYFIFKPLRFWFHSNLHFFVFNGILIRLGLNLNFYLFLPSTICM